MSATLYVNRSDSRCGECGREAKMYEDTHEWAGMGPWDAETASYPDGPRQGCGVRWTHVSSDYSDYAGLHDAIRRKRPDLEWEEPFWTNRVREP